MNNQDNKGLDLNELYIEELGQVVGGAEQKSSLRVPITVTLMLGEGVPAPCPLPPKPPTHTLLEEINRWLPITKVST